MFVEFCSRTFLLNSVNLISSTVLNWEYSNQKHKNQVFILCLTAREAREKALSEVWRPAFNLAYLALLLEQESVITGWPKSSGSKHVSFIFDFFQ